MLTKNNLGSTTSTVLVLVGLLALTFCFAWVTWPSLLQPLVIKSKIKGQVLDSSGSPIASARLALESGYYDSPHSPEPVYGFTDSNGGFELPLRGREYRLTVWHPGYAPAVCSQQSCENTNFNIVLRRTSTTNKLKTNDDVIDLSKTLAFSFRQGRAVDSSSPDADFLINFQASDCSQFTIIAAPGAAIGQNSGAADQDFDDDSTAPDVYYASAQASTTNFEVFFLRTAETKYAKFRIKPECLEENGNKRLDFTNSRIIWAYQTDGTRIVETADSTNPPPIFKKPE